jgi:hypothetical protein
VTSIGTEYAQGIAKTTLQHGIKPPALFREKTCVVPICHVVGDIALLVGNVEVSHHDEGLSKFPSLAHVFAKPVKKPKFHVEPRQLALGDLGARSVLRKLSRGQPLSSEDLDDATLRSFNTSPLESANAVKTMGFAVADAKGRWTVSKPGREYTELLLRP